jgi:hypothetical protein
MLSRIMLIHVKKLPIVLCVIDYNCYCFDLLHCAPSDLICVLGFYSSESPLVIESVFKQCLQLSSDLLGNARIGAASVSGQTLGE